MFPSQDTFARDRRVAPRHLRVYRDLTLHLDFQVPRERKVDSIALETGMHRADAARSLRDLIDWGYVTLCGRDRYGTRLFTLTWSVAKSPTTGDADAA